MVQWRPDKRRVRHRVLEVRNRWYIAARFSSIAATVLVMIQVDDWISYGTRIRVQRHDRF
jgi:hypothetical protein